MLNLRLKKIYKRLPTYEYELVEGGTYIGKIQIRHKPSCGKNMPSDMANNIYYEIESSQQKKGYGKLILKLGLVEAKKSGLSEVIITCMKINTASKKIIEANGGKFLYEKPLLDNSDIILKYKITLK